MNGSIDDTITSLPEIQPNIPIVVNEIKAHVIKVKREAENITGEQKCRSAAL